MYKIIGADRQEYGPVADEQIRRWITEGRLRGESLIQAEGSSEWKPLATFPEFADLLKETAGSGTPPLFNAPPVAPPPPNPDVLVAEVLAGRPQIDIGSCISRAWALMTERFWLTLGVGIVCMLIANVPFLYGPAYTGLFWFFLKRIRGQNARFEDAFAPFSEVLLHSFLAGLVVSALASVGFLLCIVPGIVFMSLWSFTWPLLIDKRLEFWPAMEVSRRVLWPNVWGILGLWGVSVLIALLGLLLCYVGVFVAFPLIIAAHACAYEDFFGRRPALPPANPI